MRGEKGDGEDRWLQVQVSNGFMDFLTVHFSISYLSFSLSVSCQPGVTTVSTRHSALSHVKCSNSADVQLVSWS